MQFKQEAELRGHQDAVTNMAWHPSHPDRLASISQPEKSVRFWDTRVRKNTATLPTPGANLYLAWAPDGNWLVVGNKDDLVAVVDIRKMKISQYQEWKPLMEEKPQYEEWKPLKEEKPQYEEWKPLKEEKPQ